MSRIITARFLLEEYETILKTNYGTVSTVFKNPSRKDMREVDDGKHGIRFSADNTTKTIYVWGGMRSNHYDVRTHLNLACKSGYFSGKYVCGHILDGWAEKSGSNYEMFACDSVPQGMHDIRIEIESGDLEGINYAKDILSQDWSWVERYIKVNEYLDYLRKETGWGKGK
jgi:hypothetical protein